jgi:hypothetical protein
VRTKAIITGAIAVLAAAGLTANAQTSAQRMTPGTVASQLATATLVAATAQVVASDRDDIGVAIRSTTAKPATEANDKPDSDVKGARPAIGTACQQAINTLKAMHQADVAEDAKERTASRGDDRVLSWTALTAAERAEDAAEAQQWKNALAAARSACVPQPATACKAAVSNLQSVLQTLHATELAELPTRVETDWAADVASVRTAFSAVATACASRE